MDKNFLFASSLLVLLVAPFSALADGYSGPDCFENPKGWEDQGFMSADPEGIRGTCKLVTATTIVSIDPILAKDYFLGWHESACMAPRADMDGCSSDSKYSETLHITPNSTVISEGSSNPEDGFLPYAIFDKQFFSPLLKDKFASIGESFSEANFSHVSIYVLNKTELDSISGSSDSAIAERLKNPDSFRKIGGMYEMTTLDTATYGKYIHAPKWKLVESQYVDVRSSSNLLTSAALQITSVGCGHWNLRTCLVVSPTSPLKSVTNYWIYTKVNGKLTLVWQKSEYTLDDGSVKTVTNADKNVSATLLFSHDTNPVQIQTTSITSSSTATTTASEGKKGFFKWFTDMILSWFR